MESFGLGFIVSRGYVGYVMLTNSSAKVSFWSSRIAAKWISKCDVDRKVGSYCLKWKNAPREYESSGFSWAKRLGNAKVLRAVGLILSCKAKKTAQRQDKFAGELSWWTLTLAPSFPSDLSLYQLAMDEKQFPDRWCVATEKYLPR